MYFESVNYGNHLLLQQNKKMKRNIKKKIIIERRQFCIIRKYISIRKIKCKSRYINNNISLITNVIYFSIENYLYYTIKKNI